MPQLVLIDEEFRICVDCLMYDAGYDEHETGQPWSKDYPPWGLLKEPDGSLPYTWAQNYEDEPSEEPIYHFSWAWCDACGTNLGGDRYEGHLFALK